MPLFMPGTILHTPSGGGGLSTFDDTENGTQFVTNAAVIGVKFTADATGGVSQVEADLTANSAGGFIAKIYSDSSDAPGSQVGSTSNSSGSGTGDLTATFSSAPSVTSGTDYWLILERQAGSGNFTVACVNDNSNFVTRYDAGGSPSGLTSGDELSSNRDMRFRITIT